MAYGLKIPEQKKQIFFLKTNNFIFLCAGSSLLQGLFSSYREHSLSVITVLRLLIVVASLVVEHSLQSFWASVVVAFPGGSEDNLSTM